MAMFKYYNHDETEMKFYAYIRYAIEVPYEEEIHPQYQCPFPVFKWEQSRTYVGRVKPILTQLIDVSSIIGLAFMIPVFSTTDPQPICSKPDLLTDRFWYIDRKFCDRAGWDDITNVDVINNIALPNLNDVDIHVAPPPLNGLPHVYNDGLDSANESSDDDGFESDFV
jgi:hypothetical protein